MRTAILSLIFCLTFVILLAVSLNQLQLSSYYVFSQLHFIMNYYSVTPFRKNMSQDMKPSFKCTRQQML